MSEELGNDEGGGADTQIDNTALESEAKLFGWVPKDEFRGNEDQWIDAESFVKRGKEINPILKKNNDRLMGELKKRDKAIEDMQLTLNEFGDMYRKMSESAYARALEDVKSQIRSAREDGDHDLVDKLEDQRDALKEESKNIKVPGTGKDETASSQIAQRQEVLQTWSGENRWYDAEKNPDLVYLADGYAVKLAKLRPDLVGTRAFLDEVTSEVKRVSPDKFKNPNRVSGSPVGGGTESRTASTGTKKQSYNDMPPEAKQACDRMTTKGKPGYIEGFTRDKYVANYFEE